MLLTRLSMTNFMPYRGKQTIEFPIDSQRRVAVVFGENMRGKTSLLNGIRWTLYGTAIARHGRKIARRDLVNRDAASEGEHTVTVVLHFLDDGKDYEVRRQIVPRELVTQPRNDSDFDETISLRIDGTVVPASEIERILDRLLPEDISRFFLFDGESLQEYETLIMEDTDGGDVIKERIEQVLGVPALINARDHLMALLDESRREQSKAMKRDRALAAQAEELERLTHRKEALIEDLSRLQGQKQAQDAELDKLEDFIRRTEADQRLASKRDSIKDQLANLKANVSRLELQRRDYLSDAWIDLVWPRVNRRKRELEDKLVQKKAIDEDLVRLRVEIGNYEKLLNDKVCPTCGETIVEAREKWTAQKQRAEMRLADLAEQTEIDPFTGTDLNHLRKIAAGKSASAISRIEKQMRQESIEIAGLAEKLRELNERLKSLDTAEMGQKREQHKAKNKLLARLESRIAELKDQITDVERQEGKVSNMIAKNPAARNDRSNVRVQVLEDLHAVVKDSIEHLREGLRGKVEEFASEAFRALTTDPSYQGLKIDNNYGLQIIDDHGRIVAERSAGAEQIVALALISGLNRTANREAPIIMDTPLGRLDPRHRENVLRHLPKMSKQVVLLVHEGELRPDSDLEPIADRIGRMYQIEYVTSSQSRIDSLRC